MNDPRMFAPSAARNMAPIQAVLLPRLPDRGIVLEIASGSGEHITSLATAAAGDDAPRQLIFQPSDPNPAARQSIDAWRGEHGADNVRPAVAIDATASDWPIDRADAVMCINMIHISPWNATLGLIRGAYRLIPADGFLFTYGPYRRDGEHTSEGNAVFDAQLRSQNPEWGIRDVEDVTAVAMAEGFASPEIIEMPANNLSLFFARRD